MITITFHFWSVQSITITQKTVIDYNRLRLTHVWYTVSTMFQYIA